MSRLQSIERKLQEINEAVFQELCNCFLFSKNEKFVISRIGSQKGKQKTIKGTPDTVLLFPDGKYTIVEYSTNITRGLSKFKEDIHKCIDSKKTNIPLEQIEEVILCFNFNLKPNEIQELESLLKNTRIRLTLYNLDTLAFELHLNHRNLVHEYLGLPLDTGQIVSKERFIKEYAKASQGIATPLDNPFLHRKEDLNKLQNQLKTNDVIIVTGSAGVGKTKFALEGIGRFLKENTDFKSHFISYKHCDLHKDLRLYMDDDKNYILCVDDANRIDALEQIIGFYKSLRKGQLKIIFTVRDYAFQDVQKKCQEYHPRRIELKKISEKQITEIIKQKPFNILNQDYQTKINELADGNPRIAIMATQLANEKQDISVLYNVSKVFENYFSTFIRDKGELSQEINTKCLGLIAFFYAISYKDKEITSTILKHFDMEYASFIEVIDKLEKLELVEIQFEHVKIPEQNLSTFFFYKAFIKEKVLSFETLVWNYYEGNQNRLKDSLIPAHNSFGGENVVRTLKPTLNKYWKSIQNNSEKAFNFLSAFWFCLTTKTLYFVLQITKNLKDNASDCYVVSYDRNAFAFNRNKVLELIENFYSYNPEYLEEALQIAFEYARKEPKHLPELIFSIKEKLMFGREDTGSEYIRQNTLFEILIEKVNQGNDLFARVFYELSKTFLEFQFHHTNAVRPHSLVSYWYLLPNTKPIKTFRKRIWETVDKNFITYPKESRELLMEYANRKPGDLRKIMEYDVPFVLKIIENHMSNQSFEDCQYVHKQIWWFQNNSIEHLSFKRLSHSFTNATYETYLKIDWDATKNIEFHGFSFQTEYEQKREKELKTSFVFEDEKGVNEFYKTFAFLKEKEKKDDNYNKSLDIIVDENFKHNPIIGINLLQNIVDDNQMNYIPIRIFENHLNKRNVSEKIWSFLEKNRFRSKVDWELSFLYHLSEELIEKKHIDGLMKVMNQLEDSQTIHLKHLLQFLSFDPNIFQRMFQKIVKNNNNGRAIRIWVDMFHTIFEKHLIDEELIKKSYIQQLKIQRSFDYEGKVLLKIVKKEPRFLVAYVLSLYSEKDLDFLANNRAYGFVWQIKNIEPVIRDVFDVVIEKVFFLGIQEHFCNAFFSQIPNEYYGIAKNFIFEYVTENHGNRQKMNVIADIIRNSMKDLFADVLLLYVSLNQDSQSFFNINWVTCSRTYRGDVIISDIDAMDWENILSIVSRSNLGMDIIPIRDRLEETIENLYKSGKNERMSRFLQRV
ncbi:MAG: hypothetical protein OXE55_00500 [Flavobacteriaceae bacterium]|nr:hypothetical protein [Flavobacteriaceae bacterium]